MTMIGVDSIVTPDLRASAFIEGTTFGARFSGNADTRAMAAIDTLLKGLHDQALQRNTREVVIDLTELEFMNSSCFKAFVTWIANVQDLEASKQYSIVFRSDPKKHWQRRSLEALSCFAIDLIRVET